jgi:arsenite methyltransferase
MSGRPLVGRTRRNTDLWAACIGDAIPQERDVEAIESVGLRVEDIRENSQYEFISERAVGACAKYGVTSVSLVARR